MNKANFFSDFTDVSQDIAGMMNLHLRYVDLFAGGGGLSCGFNMAGLEGIAAVEFDKAAVSTYVTNFSHPVVSGDITLTATKNELYSIVRERCGDGTIDILAGGPPCQGFSMAGKRNPADPRNRLYIDYMEIVKHLKPGYVVMENVEGMKSMDKGVVVTKILSDLRELGYDVECHVLNAAGYGVAQYRERLIFIGNRYGAKNLFPAPFVSPDNYVTVTDAISDLAHASECAVFSHVYTNHSAEYVARIHRLRPGDRLSEKYRGTLRRLYPDRPSFTVTYSKGSCDIHPVCDRVLTPRELARLQSFPDDFLFCGSKGDQGKIIGNAVPPLMAKAIALAVLRMEQCRRTSLP